MRELTAQEAKLFVRYLKVCQQHDRFSLFKQARESSNALLDAAEAAIPKKNPSSYQLTYLQGINRRKSKNYRKLRGMNDLLKVIAMLKARTLEALGIGDGE
jgi:hypothetical protein